MVYDYKEFLGSALPAQPSSPSYSNASAPQLHSDNSNASAPPPPYAPPEIVPNQQYSSEVEISVQCRNMVAMDGAYKLSSPMCVLEEFAMDRWLETGRTEVIEVQLNPNFINAFRVQYHFQLEQPLRFSLYCIDEDVRKGRSTKSLSLNEAEKMGTVTCTLGELVASSEQSITKTLMLNGRNMGSITVSCSEVVESRYTVETCFRCVNTNSFSANFFLVASRMENLDGTRPRAVPVAKSGNVYGSDPVFAMKMPLQRLCNGDYYRPIQLELFQVFPLGRHKSHGKVTTNLPELIANLKKPIPLSSSFSLYLHFYDLSDRSFLDYITGGWRISLQVAIDFTLSNRNPSDPNSLHYNQNPSVPSPYERAIRSVGNILANYDPSGNYPVYGFGGRVNGLLSHCFHVNMNQESPYVSGGIEGVIEAYKQALNVVKLDGPTYFHNVLENAIKIAKQDGRNGVYNVLLLLTDGIIHDMNQTIHTVVEGSYAPLSIIIIGVGNANFDDMDTLCADEEPLISPLTKQPMLQDIVKFVPFNNYIHAAPWYLARDVLEEFPDQLLNHMQHYKIRPNLPPRPIPPELYHQMVGIPSLPIEERAGKRLLPSWVPDSESPCCQLCSNFFTLFNRRHHCRCCGRLVCQKCSAFKVQNLPQMLRLSVPPQPMDSGRTCFECKLLLQRYQGN